LYKEAYFLYHHPGLKVKAYFIAFSIFDRKLKVVKIDKAAMDYYMRLTTFHSQFRAIGTNYYQVTKAIKSTFTQKKSPCLSLQIRESDARISRNSQTGSGFDRRV
jgi:hypothetical protein